MIDSRITRIILNTLYFVINIPKIVVFINKLHTSHYEMTYITAVIHIAYNLPLWYHSSTIFTIYIPNRAMTF